MMEIFRLMREIAMRSKRLYITDVKFKLEFTVKKIYFLNDGNFTKCRVKVRDFSGYDGVLPPDPTIVGVFPNIFVEDIFTAEVMYEDTEKYGMTLKIVGEPVLKVPDTEKELSKFIKRHNKGLGQETCNNAVNVLGLDIMSRVADDPSLLDGLKNFTEKKKEKFKLFCLEHTYAADLIAYFRTLNIPAEYAIKIYGIYKKDSFNMIKRTPYILYASNCVDFYTADKISYGLGQIKWDSKNRLACAVMAYLDFRADTKGDVCVKKEDIYRDVNKFIVRYGAFPPDALNRSKEPASKGFSRELIKDVIDTLIAKQNAIFIKKADDIRYAFKSKYYHTEKELARLIKERIEAKDIKTYVSEEDTLKYLKSKNLQLSDEQTKAIVEACRNKLSILTGGPGTGKTFTVNQVTKTIKHYHKDASILLLAPTGRAASHMKEVSGFEAYTIHSALKITPGSQYRRIKDDDFVYDCDYVIMDEASMTDEWLFYAFFRKICKDASILIVGDSDQLPSVSPGKVLQDMIDSKKIPVTALTKIFRQAGVSDIVVNSHHIKNNEIDQIKFKEYRGFENDFSIIPLNDAVECAERIVDEFEKAVKACGNIEDVIVLSPMRPEVLGVNELNLHIQTRINPLKPDKPEYNKDMKILRVGDRVMQTKNNYDLGVVNGALGTITKISKKDDLEIEVKMDGCKEPVIYTEKDVRELILGYCITIHKSQGSEIAHVIMPLHSSQANMLDKKLIYTAITRAKKTFLAVGEPDLLAKGIKAGEKTKRCSLLAYMLNEKEGEAAK